MPAIELGFVEECNPLLLSNRYFPSKIGGKPAFLDLEDLPSEKDLLCEICNEPCLLLCQYYSPIESKEECFHRSVYVFVCRNGSCLENNSAKNLIVLRSQLPRINKFYPYEEPSEADMMDGIEPSSKLCKVCGCKGKLTCSRCKKVNYCGVIHQKVDWKHVHKQECQSGKIEVESNLNYLLPEFNLIIESEELPDEVEDDDEAEKKRLAEFEELVKSGKSGELDNVSEEELQQFAEGKEDKGFENFRKIMSYDAEQVTRYNRLGEPLWISSENQLMPKDVPKCENCNGEREFEFQIMPQLLNHLKHADLDWGVIVVYTCKASCTGGSKYLKEFAYKQDLVK